MANAIPTQFSPLLSLPQAQRLPSIRATVRALPQSRTRVELSAWLYTQLSQNGKTSSREVRGVEEVFLRECQQFLAINEGVVRELNLEERGDNHFLTPTIISMSSALLLLPERKLARLSAASLSKHLLLAISHSLASSPSALPGLTRLLDRIVTHHLPPSPALNILVDNIVHLALHASSLAPSLPEEQQIPLLLTFTALSLTSLTALLTHPRPSPEEAPGLAGRLLTGLGSFAAVIWTKWGGITGGFAQLQRVFYGCADVLAARPERADGCVRELVAALGQGEGEGTGVSASSTAVSRATGSGSGKAFLFTLCETLLSSLSPELVVGTLLHLCLPSLDEPEERGAFEAAHSLFLGILALSSSSAQTGPGNRESGTNIAAGEWVPYYTSCLLLHLQAGNLSEEQFRVAYTSLVRTCAALPAPPPSRAADSASFPPTPQDSAPPIDGATLAWYCVQSLVSELRWMSLIPSPVQLQGQPQQQQKQQQQPPPPPQQQAEEEARTQPGPPSSYKQTLHYTLVELIPLVPLQLLPALLEHVEAYLFRPPQAPPAGEQPEKAEKVDRAMADRVFRAIRAVGDEARGEALGWWLGVVARLGANQDLSVEGEVRARL